MAVVTGADRTDIQLAALEASTQCLILTGAGEPLPQLVNRADELEVPLLKVEQDTPRTPNFTATLNFDRSHLGAVEHKNPLNSNPLEDAPHRDGLVETSMALGDYDALVGLDTLFIALADANTNTHGVANVNLRKITLQLSVFEFSNQCISTHLLRIFGD